MLLVAPALRDLGYHPTEEGPIVKQRASKAPSTERDGIPRNQVGQPPTRNPDETEERLAEKARMQKGEANKIRTDEQIDEVRTKR